MAGFPSCWEMWREYWADAHVCIRVTIYVAAVLIVVNAVVLGFGIYCIVKGHGYGELLVGLGVPGLVISCFMIPCAMGCNCSESSGLITRV